MNNAFITGVALLLSTTYATPTVLDTVNIVKEENKSTISSEVLAKEVNKFENDFYTIKNNYKAFLVGTEEINSNSLLNSKINNIIKKGISDLNEYIKSEDTLFKGLPLSDKEKADNLNSSYLKLYEMALLYSVSLEGNTYYKNEDLKNKIIEGLEWLYTNYYSKTSEGYYGNWYHWEIGMPQNITKTLMLLEDEINSLNPEIITLYISAMDNYIRGGLIDGNTNGDIDLTSRFHTGSNLADIAFNKIIQGTLLKDDKRIEKAVSDMMTIYETIDPNNIVNGVTDGFYEDGSFIQHHRVAYTGSYGKVLLQRSMQVISTLNGSRWSNEDLIDKMEMWIYEAFAPVIYEGYMMEVVKGRGISRATTGYADTVAIVECMTQLSEAMDEEKANTLKSYIKYINDVSKVSISTNGFVSLKSIIDFNTTINDKNIVAKNAIDTSKHYEFNIMEKTVHSREGYSFVVSRSSSRISKYEYMSGENLKPWFQGDGAFYLYQSGNNQTESYGVNYMATIDPYHLPGTTTPNEIRKTIPELYGKNWYENTEHELNFTSSSVSQNDYVYFPVGTNNYSGGTTLDTYGTSAMQLGDDNAYAAKQLGLLPDDFVVYKNCNANKSWFMFDDEIVVVGSNVSDDLKRGVTTTLDNPMSLESENVVLEGKSKDSNDIITLENGKYNNLDWISYSTDSSNSSIGYYFPNSKEININKELRTANLKDIRQANSDKEVTTQFTTLTYDHGSGEENDSYAYVILPNFDKEMTSNYAENPKINILANSESVHAVEQTDLNITGYNFFNNEETTVGNVTSFNQASLMVKEENNTLKLSVSDPTFELEQIHLVLNIPNAKVISSDEKISTNISENTIDIIVNTKSANGASFEATFQLSTIDDLKAIISEAKELNESDYTAKSWNNMITVLLSVEKVSDDANQEDIDNAILELKKAVSELEKVSRVEILNIIKEAENISSEKYTKESWSNFEIALSSAKKVNEDRNSTQKEIDYAVENLKNAIENLKLKNNSGSNNNNNNNNNESSNDNSGNNNNNNGFSENDNGNSNNNNESSNNSKLPITGGTSTFTLGGIAALIIAKGFMLRKRK